MRIGIIGAGQIGATLAGKFVSAGHEVALANSKGPETIREMAEGLGARAVPVDEIGKGADVIVVAIPQGSIPRLPRKMFAELPSDVVVIDAGNYYPGIRDGAIGEIEAGMPESRWVEQQLGRPVVKAFNSILAGSLADSGRPRRAPDRIALPVAGDDSKGKSLVMGLVDAVGFDAVDAGSIADSWRQQPGSPAYCTNHPSELLKAALAAAERETLPERRDRALRMVAELPEGFVTEDVVAMNRSL